MKLHLLLPDGTQRTFTTDDGSAIAVEVLAWLEAVKP
jgi:hypothetical protein